MQLKCVCASIHPNMNTPCDGAIECYPKADVDKLIDVYENRCRDLQKTIDEMGAESSKECGDLYAEIQNQKYRRCGAMVQKCFAYMLLWQMQVGVVKDAHIRALWYNKWYRRWCDLEDYFREVVE